LICNYPSRLGHTVSRCARRDFPISRLTSDQHDSTVAGLHLLPAPHQQRDLFLRTCGHSPARMQLTTRNLRGFASSIRTWQYRSANSTRLRPTSTFDRR
jgi:hypothetical protein